MNSFGNISRPLSWLIAVLLAAAVAGCGGGGGGGSALAPAAPAPAAATGVCSGGASCVDLKTSGNYVILAQSGVTSSASGSLVTGDVGLNAAEGGFTGFGQTVDPATPSFAMSTLVTGKMFAKNYADPTPANLATATTDASNAYADAVAKVTTFPVNPTAGTISAANNPVAPAVYNWTTAVSLSDVTLNGGPDDVWVFQIGGALNQVAASTVTLTGGAQAKNVFWQVGGAVTLGAGAHLVGTVLSNAGITLGAGSAVDGRLLATTGVTIDTSTVTKP